MNDNRAYINHLEAAFLFAPKQSVEAHMLAHALWAASELVGIEMSPEALEKWKAHKR